MIANRQAATIHPGAAWARATLSLLHRLATKTTPKPTTATAKAILYGPVDRLPPRRTPHTLDVIFDLGVGHALAKWWFAGHGNPQIGESAELPANATWGSVSP